MGYLLNELRIFEPKNQIHCIRVLIYEDPYEHAGVNL